MGVLPAYPKVRRTHYLARLGGWLMVGLEGGGGSLRRGSAKGSGAGGSILGVNVQLREWVGK